MCTFQSRRARDRLDRLAGRQHRGRHLREGSSSLLEVHAENYMAETAALNPLLHLRQDYPVSLHGVALSLGSAEELDREHLAGFKALIERLEPILVSEHLAWSAVGGVYLNDLLPLPDTEESLELFCRHVDEAQDRLGRSLLIENPSSYLQYCHSSISEIDFLAEIVRRTGCRILCDVNNIHVSARNLGFDPLPYLEKLPAEAIGEIHLAGHQVAEDVDILIDNHGARVAEPVWELYAAALQRFGAVPTIVEWDTNLPPLQDLLEEAVHAQELVDAHCRPDLA
jgi:uncharacterized protein